MEDLVYEVEQEDKLEYALRLWDQAGERPSEVLEEEGLLDFFLEQLERSRYDLSQVTLYRGGTRNQELQKYNVKDYNYISSWSLSKEIASYFFEGADTKVMFVLNGPGAIHALENHYNTYNELEVIVAPIKLVVTSRVVIDSITYLYVTPL